MAADASTGGTDATTGGLDAAASDSASGGAGGSGGADGAGGAGADGGGPQNYYATNFPLTENPISEAGHWINGKTLGVDWQDVRTTPGFAFLTQPNVSSYDDSTALLTGTWGANQYVRSIVRIPTPDPSFAQEIEIRLRSSLSANRCTGYEILGGSQIVRWNGPLGDFTVLPDEGPYGALRDGDVFEANIVENVITVYINGVKVNRAVDSTYSTGSPGMGFFTRNPSPAPFGFSSFAASNGPI